MRLHDTFVADASYTRNDIDLPVGSFTTNLVRARLSYSVTARLFVQTLFQYNDRDHLFAGNVRVGWLQTANAGLYLVYNENDDTSAWRPGPQLRNRSLIAKLTLVVDLL